MQLSPQAIAAIRDSNLKPAGLPRVFTDIQGVNGVDINYRQGTVEITDMITNRTICFMQGEEASDFIDCYENLTDMQRDMILSEYRACLDW